MTLLLSLSALSAVGYGAYCTLHSPLFTARVVEVADLPENSPVDADTITRLAAVPVGHVNLFDLDLKKIEARIKTNPWVRDVVIQKRLPQAVSISVVLREPKALVRTASGGIAYVDADGQVFGTLNLGADYDLPVISGFATELVEGKTPTDSPLARDALKLLDAWTQSPLAKLDQLAELSWDSDHGYRALVVYPIYSTRATGLDPATGTQVTHGRVRVDLGHEIDADSGAQLARLERVLNYLSTHSIQARQIWADAGKKIVVKTAHGS